METKNRLTQALLAVIIVLLSVQTAITLSVMVAAVIKENNPPVLTVEQEIRQEYYKTLYDLAMTRANKYQDDVYNDPDVDNINKQMERQLEYIFMELNSLTQIETQKAMDK
jgi:hypothetical protein